jgi:hypothetical protein
MAVLARDSPLKGPLQLGDWLQRLLYFAADAAAARDPPLASRALDGFSAAAAVRIVLPACIAHSVPALWLTHQQHCKNTTMRSGFEVAS